MVESHPATGVSFGTLQLPIVPSTSDEAELQNATADNGWITRV